MWVRRMGALGARAWPVLRPGALARPAGTAPWCVPALFGLGTPSWAPLAAAEIGGLTADSTGAEIAEAAMIGVAHQIVDAVDAVAAGLAGPAGALRGDGGLRRHHPLVPAIAALSGVRLERTGRAPGP